MPYSITPMLSVRDAARAVAFYKAALGAVVEDRIFQALADPAAGPTG